MKVLKIIISIMSLLTIAAILVMFMFIKTLDLNRFKAQIQEQIGNSIGREVSIKNILFNFSLRRGVILDVSGLSIIDQPSFSSETMVYIDSTHFDIDILPFFLDRQIRIVKVELHSPKVNFIQNSKGEVNFGGLKSRNDAPLDSKKGREKLATLKLPSQKSSKKIEEQFSFGKMSVHSLRVTDGTFIYTGQSVAPEIVVPVSNIDFTFSNISLNSVFPFLISASLWSESENIRISGLAQVSDQNYQVRIDDVVIRTDLAQLVLPSAYQSFPNIDRVKFNKQINGRAEIHIDQAILGQEGLLMLSAEGRIIDGEMQFAYFPVPIEGLNAHFEMSELNVDLKEIRALLAEGEIEASGRISDYRKENRFIMELNMKDLQILQLLADIDLPLNFEGKLNGQFKLKGQGYSDEEIRERWEGEGNFSVQEGRIRDVNLLKLILSKISFVPDWVDRIEDNLPEKYKDKLSHGDTVFDKVQMVTRIQNGELLFERIEVSGDGISLIVNGKIDFDQMVTLKGDFYISPDLSAGLVAASQELNYFLDDQKRIHIPLKPYYGDIYRISMYPDVEDIGKEIIRNRGKEELKKVLRKALDIEENPPSQPSKPGEPIQVEREKSPEEDVIENILDMIPIFK